MAYAGIQMFTEKLKQLINSNDNPFINNPEIIRERPQFQLLYDELNNPLFQTLFIDQHQHLQKVTDLKKKFTDAAEEAHYTVDIFLSGVHIRYNQHLPTYGDHNPSLNLDDVMRSLESVKLEISNMNLDSYRRRDRRLDQSSAAAPAPAPISFTRTSRGSKNLLDEVVVGLEDDLKLIRDKLMGDQENVDVVSIVGMAGIGKTTLATKVFNDTNIMSHFEHARVWVTVSQKYDKRDVLIQILDSIRGQLHLEKSSESQLHEMVHKRLIPKRYLIVIDDIWHTETWDNIKLFFPRGKPGSRILLTSRLTEVANHANSKGLIHHLGCLDKERSWELLSRKVFLGNECPSWSVKPGMLIVERCQGLPLAVAIIAGVLAKEAMNEKFWVEFADRTASYIVGDQNGCMETLALSYHHLPLHLRDCFLYLGGFPEDYKFQVQKLILLWVAEGFIQQDGNRSLEDIAEGYLMDLIDRGLVIVADTKNSNGAVNTCKLHDLVRELCLKIAKEERFTLQTERPILSSHLSNVTTPPYKPCRMFINKDIYHPNFGHLPSKSL